MLTDSCNIGFPFYSEMTILPVIPICLMGVAGETNMGSTVHAACSMSALCLTTPSQKQSGQSRTGKDPVHVDEGSLGYS